MTKYISQSKARNDVKRYTPDSDIGVFPADDGGLVKWEDYDAVVAERDALKARLATATQLAENTAAGLAATTTRLAEALFLLNRWHEAYHADGGMEMLDDDTTTCLAGITVSASEVQHGRD